MNAKKSPVLDVLALVLCAVSLVPQLTGAAAHEWLGLVTAVVFLAHVAMHVRPPGETSMVHGRLRAANLVVDALAFASLAVVVLSGLGISGSVLRSFGLYAGGYYLWDPLHAASAKALLALLIVHVALHARFVLALTRRKAGAVL